ncbi:MAG TPA: pyridoxal phosphate-dependent aminotransferase [Longimicrobiaceae bacterium]|nr:pyridoxal phosphate-dependent aminotransferase [Longimicrobiaceae bacterium]
MTEFSENIAALQPSATIAVSSRAKQLRAEGRDIIDLCVGEPDFPTPRFIADAGVEAIRAGHTRYTPAPGIPELRAAIAADLQRLSPGAGDIEAHGIVVSAGAKQALFNVCFSLFGPGDRVLIPVPYWTSYPAIVELTRAEPVLVDGDAERSFKVTVDALDRAAAGGAKGLLLNSPGNPSGAVYTKDELEEIARWAADRGIWLISDEIYRRIYFEGDLAPGILDLPGELLERAVLIDGASKAFAMTGWRIGFSYSAKALAAKVSALQSQTTTHAPTPSQHAALAAYRADPAQLDECRAMQQSFNVRKQLLTQLFREKLPDVEFVDPAGAFYLWIATGGLANAGENSVEVCERILQSTGVALVPGTAFGDDRYLRLSFAASEDTLRDAVNRLATGL